MGGNARSVKLSALMSATIIICLPIVELLSRLNIVSEILPDVGAVRNVGTLGVLLAVTAAIRAFERWQLWRGFSKSKLILSLAMSTISLLRFSASDALDR
jgi:hypothetical protein